MNQSFNAPVVLRDMLILEISKNLELEKIVKIVTHSKWSRQQYFQQYKQDKKLEPILLHQLTFGTGFRL